MSISCPNPFLFLDGILRSRFRMASGHKAYVYSTRSQISPLYWLVELKIFTAVGFWFVGLVREIMDRYAMLVNNHRTGIYYELSHYVRKLGNRRFIHYSFPDGPVKKDIGCNGLRGSEITLYGETPLIQIEKADKMQPRTKVKTNGHFTTYMQVGVNNKTLNDTLWKI